MEREGRQGKHNKACRTSPRQWTQPKAESSALDRTVLGAKTRALPRFPILLNIPKVWIIDNNSKVEKTEDDGERERERPSMRNTCPRVCSLMFANISWNVYNKVTQLTEDHQLLVNARNSTLLADQNISPEKVEQIGAKHSAPLRLGEKARWYDKRCLVMDAVDLVQQVSIIGRVESVVTHVYTGGGATATSADAGGSFGDGGHNVNSLAALVEHQHQLHAAGRLIDIQAIKIV